MWLFTSFFWWAPNPHPFFWPSVLCRGGRSVTLQLKATKNTNAKSFFYSHETVSELLITSTNCKKWDTVLIKKILKKSSFLPYFMGVKMKQSLQESYYQPCAHPAPAHALYHLLKEEGKQGGDPLWWDFLHHRFRSQLCFYSRASEKGEVNPAVAIIRRTWSQSGTNVPRGCKYKAGTFFRKSSRNVAWKPEQNRPISARHPEQKKFSSATTCKTGNRRELFQPLQPTVCLFF